MSTIFKSVHREKKWSRRQVAFLFLKGESGMTTRVGSKLSPGNIWCDYFLGTLSKVNYMYSGNLVRPI